MGVGRRPLGDCEAISLHVLLGVTSDRMIVKKQNNCIFNILVAVLIDEMMGVLKGRIKSASVLLLILDGNQVWMG